MFREMLKSKIHRAVVTEANLNYVGSITIDEDLMENADIIENEKVLVVDINNGLRFETYVIPGKRGSGIICLNGAAARMVQVEDKVIIISFALLNEDELKDHKPTLVYVGEKNEIKEIQNKR
ncbi:aspartate 1-decarboxylase [Ruminiclostridium cellobioparum]|jgi:aspartate 1-decarboxylase|uniref:aspartate 1-decarboxylase n=1 Tax=Ruminiclostridium cellobioparum TaxID=29355 RepID=UPI000484D533|nr:aspartate 1-decarboxylase [Ruminiclostridium cellobioparum]